MKTPLTTLLLLAASGPALFADITVGPPASPAPQVPTRTMGNCDLLASNTVRATFVGLRNIQTQSFDQEAPTTAQVAVFQVIDNLAYRRLVRYGDGRLLPGTNFAVAMDRELPGQPATVVDTISRMQPGEEAALRMDHLYLFGDAEGKSIRPCARIARKQDAATQQPVDAAQPVAPRPLVSGYSAGRSRQFSVSVNPDGSTQSVEVISEKLPGSDEVKTRMFINGQEVDPTTRQPLNAAPAPAPAPTPAANEEGDKQDRDSDTIVEHAPQNAAPVPPPAPAPVEKQEGF